MVDPNFIDPEQQSRVYHQKMEAMKLLMSEIIDNPNANDLKQVVDYLDKKQSTNDENE